MNRYLQLACHSAACAPPPAGTGGSLSGTSRAAARTKSEKANTSLYPVDVHPKIGPDDAHPEAPGASNPDAVKSRSDRRIPRQGETIDIYRDLGRGREILRGFPDHDAFSIKLASGLSGASAQKAGLVVATTVGVLLSNPRPAWAQSSKAGFEKAGKRGVHAFVRGEVDSYVTPEEGQRSIDGWQKITYYPGSEDFFHPETRERWVGGEKAVLVKGQFYVKNPIFVEGSSAPVTPIERKIAEAVKATRP